MHHAAAAAAAVAFRACRDERLGVSRRRDRRGVLQRERSPWRVDDAALTVLESPSGRSSRGRPWPARRTHQDLTSRPALIAIQRSGPPGLDTIRAPVARPVEVSTSLSTACGSAQACRHRRRCLFDAARLPRVRLRCVLFSFSSTSWPPDLDDASAASCEALLALAVPVRRCPRSHLDLAMRPSRLSSHTSTTCVLV